MHNPYLKLGLSFLSGILYFGVYAITLPIRRIDQTIADMAGTWSESKECQSVSDRYLAGKLTYAEYMVANQTPQATMLWLELTTLYPDQTTYIARRLKEVYPQASVRN